MEWEILAFEFPRSLTKHWKFILKKWLLSKLEFTTWLYVCKQMYVSSSYNFFLPWTWFPWYCFSSKDVPVASQTLLFWLHSGSLKWLVTHRSQSRTHRIITWGGVINTGTWGSSCERCVYCYCTEWRSWSKVVVLSWILAGTSNSVDALQPKPTRKTSTINPAESVPHDREGEYPRGESWGVIPTGGS